jgi:hypothetical protein
MTDVLYDIRLTQAIYNNDPQFASDEMKDALVEGVLRKHNITQAELDSSLLWYSDNIEYYKAINDTVADWLKAKNELLEQSRMASQDKGRLMNRLIPSFFYLNRYTPTLSFDIDTIKIKTVKNISDFHLNFDIQGVSTSQKVEAAVYFNYKDTLVKRIILVENNRHYSINKPVLPDSLLKSISGYIHLGNNKNSLSNVLIYNINYMPASPDRPAADSETNISATLKTATHIEKNANSRLKSDRVIPPENK